HGHVEIGMRARRSGEIQVRFLDAVIEQIVPDRGRREIGPFVDDRDLLGRAVQGYVVDLLGLVLIQRRAEGVRGFRLDLRARFENPGLPRPADRQHRICSGPDSIPAGGGSVEWKVGPVPLSACDDDAGYRTAESPASERAPPKTAGERDLIRGGRGNSLACGWKEVEQDPRGYSRGDRVRRKTAAEMIPGNHQGL